jgi:hypothetical protein
MPQSVHAAQARRLALPVVRPTLLNKVLVRRDE